MKLPVRAVHIKDMNGSWMREGWWIGDARGRRGLFPANYVELI